MEAYSFAIGEAKGIAGKRLAEDRGIADRTPATDSRPRMAPLSAVVWRRSGRRAAFVSDALRRSFVRYSKKSTRNPDEPKKLIAYNPQL